jgi:hypothetical protein
LCSSYGITIYVAGVSTEAQNQNAHGGYKW